MGSNPTITQPEFAARFKCASSECEDVCCSGWRVFIDKSTFEKYEQHPDAEIKEMLMRRLIRNEAESDAERHAEIVLDENICPFLMEDKLCKIQSECGEDYLSLRCNNYPRHFNQVDGELERTLNLSCPEAASAALLGTAPLRFLKTVTAGNKLRNGKLPVLNTQDPAYADTLYPYFNEIRSFIFNLLQNRSVSIDDRLVILGLFCRDLEALESDAAVHEAPKLMEAYIQRTENDGFSQVIGSIPVKPAVLLKILITLIEYRIQTDVTGQRFLECFEEFKLGLMLHEAPEGEPLIRNYSYVKSTFYKNFAQELETVYENYFVNYAFKTLFPLGPQNRNELTGNHIKAKTVFSHYMLLVIQYAMIKNLLVGMAGFHKNRFGTQQIVKLIQSFSKNIEHNAPYLEKLRNVFEESGMLDFSCAVMLIKN